MHNRSLPSSLPSDGLAQRLEKALREHFRENMQGFRDGCITRRSEHAFSTVFTFDVFPATATARFIAKTAKDHPANASLLRRRNQAIVEYEALRILFPGFAGVEGCRVPRPVAVFPELRTYVMEYVPGTLLGDELRCLRPFSSPARFRSLCRAYFLTGRWLKHFQELSGIHEADSTVLDGMIARCGELLLQTEAATSARTSKNVRDLVTDGLESARGQLAGMPIPVAGLHGDFGPWNVMMCEDGIVVLDFFDVRTGPVISDPLQVLVQLDDELQSFTSSRRRVAMLRSAFLEGYGDCFMVAPPLLDFCETYQRAISLMTCFLARKRGARRVFEQSRIARKQIAWLAGRAPRRSLWPDAAGVFLRNRETTETPRPAPIGRHGSQPL